MKRLIKTKQPCPKCTSSDAASYWAQDDGTVNGHCFSCNSFLEAEEMDTSPKYIDQGAKVESLDEVNKLSTMGIPDRRISKQVSDFYGIKERFDENGNSLERFYPVYKQQTLVGYKKRVMPKDFSKGRVGDTGGEIQLFGQHLFRDGRVVVVTAGEEDALASFEMTQHKSKAKRGLPSVSLPNGCNAKSIKDNLQWFDNFESVVFAVDQEDDKDLAMALEFCNLLPPGKGKIARFSENDPSDMCKAGKFTEFYTAIYQAQAPTPLGVVKGSETWDAWASRDNYTAIPFPEEWGMSKFGQILRIGSLLTVGAGTGQGKTTLLKELQHHIFRTTDLNVGIIHLEEPLCDSVGGLMSLHLGKRLVEEGHGVPEHEQKAAWHELFSENRFVFEQAFGAMNLDGLISKIRYMVKSCDCKYIFIDHLTMLTDLYCSGKDGSKIEQTAKLVSTIKNLTQELEICIVLVSHLRKRKDDVKSYENGAVPDLDSLYGAAAIKQYSDTVLVLQRDQSADPSITKYHIIKNRLTGKVGPGNGLTFNFQSGRMEMYREIDIKEVM